MVVHQPGGQHFHRGKVSLGSPHTYVRPIGTPFLLLQNEQIQLRSAPLGPARKYRVPPFNPVSGFCIVTGQPEIAETEAWDPSPIPRLLQVRVSAQALHGDRRLLCAPLHGQFAVGFQPSSQLLRYSASQEVDMAVRLKLSIGGGAPIVKLLFCRNSTPGRSSLLNFCRCNTPERLLVPFDQDAGLVVDYRQKAVHMRLQHADDLKFGFFMRIR